MVFIGGAPQKLQSSEHVSVSCVVWMCFGWFFRRKNKFTHLYLGTCYTCSYFRTFNQNKHMPKNKRELGF